MAVIRRFRDDGSSLYPFALHEVLVVCPRCSARATVTSQGDRDLGTRRRLVCTECGLAREKAGTMSVWGRPVDPWFEEPLWLTERLGEHTVWAYDRAHVEVLRDYVAATHRQRSGAPSMSMVERLPTWFKARTNRPRLLTLLERMLERTG